jgi:amidase
MSELAFRPAVELAAAIRRRELGSRELLEHYLVRIERLNPRVNAVVTLDVDRARARADAADAALARGESWGPIHGLPMTIKDSLETAGLRTTSGAPELAEHVPAADAPAVARVVAAGAIVFGKTNLPTYASDAQTYNPVFGTTNNPWDPTRVPGGSSGGSAAALAAGLTGLELGSDIGGSIRNPSHYCGVYGHKPTFGIVPTRGHIPGPPGALAEFDLGTVGPMARSAEDLALELDLIAGPLPERAGAWRLELPPPRRNALRDYRVAAWLDDPACPVDGAVRQRLEAAVERLRRAGVRVDERARPGFDLGEAFETYGQLLWPIMTSGAPDDAFQNLIEVAERQGDGGALGRFARWAVLRHRHWLAADERRERYRAAWAALFRDHDVLLCPVTPVVAHRHDHGDFLARTLRVNGADRPYLDVIVWCGVMGNLSLLPVTAAPVGRTSEGLPVGVQIVGPYLEDRTPIDFARRMAEVVGGFEPPPGY